MGCDQVLDDLKTALLDLTGVDQPPARGCWASPCSLALHSPCDPSPRYTPPCDAICHGVWLAPMPVYSRASGDVSCINFSSWCSTRSQVLCSSNAEWTETARHSRKAMMEGESLSPAPRPSQCRVPHRCGAGMFVFCTSSPRDLGLEQLS